MKKLLGAVAFVAISSAAASAATLSTGLTANNGQRGLMFDIEVAGADLTLTGLTTDFYEGTTADYELYYVLGGISGNENSAANWTLLDSMDAFTGTVAQQSWDFADLALSANSTYGLYLTNNSGGGIRYADGLPVGTEIASDANLKIFAGLGKDYPFALAFPGRSLAGSLTYTVGAPTPVPLPASLPLLGLGLFGLYGWGRRKTA